VTAPARRRRGIPVTGLQAGIIMAFAAVAAGSFFEVRPPEAYGVCMVCHGRDLVNSIANSLTDSRLVVAQSALVFPLLTTVGVVIGGWLGAITSGEYRFRKPSKPVRDFVYGMLVMNFGLLAAGCSTRLALRTAAGDIAGVAGFALMAVGVVLATLWLKRKALR
jgi:hypothetical protein